MPSTSLPWSKLLLTDFAERYIFKTGESVRRFWGKQVYQSANGEDVQKIEFEEWHTAMQYIEMIQFVALGRRRSSAVALE